MNPLYVNVFPSSSKQSSEDHGYDDVSSTEIVFPNFQDLRRLGRGSYGTVVQCYFRGRVVAAKLVESNVDHIHIHNEAKILHEFKHENIIQFYAAFHGDHSGLLLELMEGGSLNELLHQNQHVKYLPCHVLGWALQVTSALSYLHGHGYVHRDLKPSNMLLTRDYITLKLCDFGTAVDLRTSMTNNRGSAAWMAPEVFRGRNYDQKCDIFSFGILLWEMITRKQPFDDFDSNPYTILWQVSEGRRPCTIVDCPQPIMELILRCWSDDPVKRPYINEVAQIVEILCEIYPNRFFPLIDRTTGQQAFAEAAVFRPPTQSYFPTSPYSPNSLENTRSSLPPPISQPATMDSIRGHRRGNSHDFRLLQPDRVYGCGNTHSVSDLNMLSTSPTNANQPNRYSPNLIPINSQIPQYSFPVSSPLPTAQPYNPCRTTPVLPPLPLQQPPPSNMITNAPIYTPCGEIGWRRSSEPPISDTDTGYSSTKDRRHKKSYGLRKLFNGIKKVFI